MLEVSVYGTLLYRVGHVSRSRGGPGFVPSWPGSQTQTLLVRGPPKHKETEAQRGRSPT